jgi:sporulation protein YlmC with PRC-barrel domain
MQIETQAVVRMEDGTEVGRIDRVVVNPASSEVTHLVLKKGILPEDKVVPMGRVDAGTDEGVILRGDEAELEYLPAFEEKHFVEAGGPDVPEAAAAGSLNLVLGPGYVQPSAGAMGAARRRSAVEVTRNIPDGTVALKAGASVVAADSRKVGRVEQFRIRPGTDEVSELVIAQGLLRRTRRRIPMQWVQRLTDSVVRLQVGSAMVQKAKRAS